ncbi:hypothetical protein Tco_1481143 [Tanacetum coccineum]
MCQNTILGDVDVQTRFDTTSNQFNDPPLLKVNIFRSGEDSMQLMELMAYCIVLCEFVSKKQKERCVLKNRKSALIGVYTAWHQRNTTSIKLVLLVKSEGSEGFHEIIDFITSSHLYYALTKCPILYISLIEQFWQIAALSTTEDGVRAITATIDGRDKIITEAFIRIHLKLQDYEGLTSLPNAEIFKQLTRMGVVTPLFDTMLVQPQDEAPSTSPLRITSSPSLSSYHTTSSTPTTPPSIQTTHEAEETTTMPYDLPLLGGHTPGSDEGRLKHNEVMELVTKLSNRVVAMEEDFK